MGYLMAKEMYLKRIEAFIMETGLKVNKHGFGIYKQLRDSRSEGGFLVKNIPKKYKHLS